MRPIFKMFHLDLPPVIASELEPVDFTLRGRLQDRGVVAAKLNTALLSQMANKKTRYFLINEAIVF